MAVCSRRLVLISFLDNSIAFNSSKSVPAQANGDLMYGHSLNSGKSWYMLGVTFGALMFTSSNSFVSVGHLEVLWAEE